MSGGTPKAIEFTLYTRAVPKGMPRTYLNPKTGRPIVAKPPKTRRWEEFVAHAAQDHLTEDTPLDCPLKLKAYVYVPRPKSCPKSRLFPTVRPDLKNLIASVEDGMNGILYVDDRLICMHDTGKFYGDPPRVEIGLYPLTEEDLP